MALPASAVLASTLIQKSPHGQTDVYDGTVVDVRHGDGSNWDLTRDIDLGVPCSSDRTVFSCGRVVGISGLQSPANDQSDSDGGDGSNIHAWVGELSLHILANTLTRTRSDSYHPRAFAVQFLDYRPISQESLHHAIQQRCPDKPAADVEGMTSKVQLYQTFEFDDILDAVSRISDSLYNIQQQKNSSSTAGDEPVLVVLEGIDRALEEIIRKSNPVAAQAELIPLLRTLTILSRTYASFVTIIVVNAIPLPSTVHSPQQQGREYRPTQQTSTDGHQRPHRLIPVQSIFAQAPTPDPSTASPGPFQRPATSYASLLARSFDQGFDTHLLVSKVQERMIIEVAKDRLGENMGRWCAL